MAGMNIHTVYKNSNSKRVPSVTTVLGILAKPALIHWAWKEGVEGRDYKKVRDQKADTGTGIHEMILAHHKGETPDQSAYTKEQIDQIENGFLKYLDWEKEHPLEVIMVEKPIVNEIFQFGGTPDLVAKHNGKTILVDYKSGKAIYDEMPIQLSAYVKLLEGIGQNIDNARILRVGRDENEGFEERTYNNLDKYWQIFIRCLEIYKLQKELKGGN